MRTRIVSQDRETQLEQLHMLRLLLEDALNTSNELHHRIREIQLRVAQLSTAIETGDRTGVGSVP
jgi:hypothetical protein